MDNSSTVPRNYTEIVHRLPRRLKLAYGIGHVLNDICASMWFTYLLVFFHYVLKFSSTMSGIILLIGQVADALATPFVGYFSDQNDNLWLCKYGKRKIWHLIGSLCVLFTFPFIFSYCIDCENAHQWAQLIYYAGFVIIFQFGWASVQISHLSLVPEITPNEHERTELIAVRYTFTVFSNILVYVVMWAVLHITSDASTDSQIGPNDVYKFERVVLIGIVIGAITTFLFHIYVQETTENNINGSLNRHTRSVSMILKDIELYKVAGVYMPTRLFINLSQIYIPLYLHETLNMPAITLAIIPLTMFLSSFVTSLIIERLNTKLGRKISYSIGFICGICTCTWIWFGRGDSYVKYEIYPLSILLGCSGSIMLVTSLGICADFIGQNTEIGAFVYGAMSFTDKLSNGIVVVLIQYFRYKGENCYYRDILVFVCGGSAVMGIAMILLMKPKSNNTNYRNLCTAETIEDVDSSNSTSNINHIISETGLHSPDSVT